MSEATASTTAPTTTPRASPRWSRAPGRWAGSASAPAVARVLRHQRRGDRHLGAASTSPRHPPVPLERIVADMNLDGIGRSWQRGHGRARRAGRSRRWARRCARWRGRTRPVSSGRGRPVAGPRLLRSSDQIWSRAAACQACSSPAPGPTRTITGRATRRPRSTADDDGADRAARPWLAKAVANAAARAALGRGGAEVDRGRPLAFRRGVRPSHCASAPGTAAGGTMMPSST